jgi:hypothetical protein
MNTDSRRLSRHIEASRLLAVYEDSRVRELAASARLLYSSARLPYFEYMRLVGELHVMRKECDQNMIAVKAYQNSPLV